MEKPLRGFSPAPCNFVIELLAHENKGSVKVRTGLVSVCLFPACCGGELLLEVGLCGKLRGVDEEKIPAVVPHVHHNRGDRGIESIPQIAKDQRGEEYQGTPDWAMAPEVKDCKQEGNRNIRAARTIDPASCPTTLYEFALQQSSKQQLFP